MQPLIPEYLASRRRDLTRIADAIAAGDFKMLHKIGHDLNGSGAAYGLPPISEFGRMIEDAALAGDAVRVRAGADELRTFLDNVKLPP